MLCYILEDWRQSQTPALSFISTFPDNHMTISVQTWRDNHLATTNLSWGSQKGGSQKGSGVFVCSSPWKTLWHNSAHHGEYDYHKQQKGCARVGVYPSVIGRGETRSPQIQKTIRYFFFKSTV